MGEEWMNYEFERTDERTEPISLLPGEKILWQSKPEWLPFILSGVGMGTIIGGLLFLSIAIFWTTGVSDAGAPPEITWFLSLFIIIGLLLVFGIPIAQMLRYNNTLYTITDKRIITQTGVIGLDTRYIELDWVREIYVRISVVDRIFGTGSVMVSTASGTVYAGPNQPMIRPTIVALADPYAVQNIIQQAMQDSRKRRPAPLSE
jgi:uncharacterized membrane protein YdbT with pleckstrin-like domain